VDDLAHLPVGGGESAALDAVWEKLAEMHGALLILRKTERGSAQGAGEGGEEMGGAGFVIPDVGAIAEATAGVVVDAFEAVELTVGGAEGSGGAHGGEICHGGFDDSGWQRAFAHGFDEELGLGFEFREVLGGVFGGGPGVGKFGCIPVADDGVFLAFGRAPTAAGGSAIGKVPGEEEFVSGGLAGGNGALEAERADGVGFFGIGTERAIGGEIVPEKERGVPPAAGGPAREMGKGTGALVHDGDDEAAVSNVVFGERRVGHDEAGEAGGDAEFVAALIGFTDGIVDGPGDGDFGGTRVGILDAITQDSDGKARIVGLMGNEGREGFEADGDGDGGIGKRDAGEGKFASKMGRGEAREAGRVLRAETVLAFVGWLIAGFENVGDGLGIADLRPDGGQGVFEVVTFVGMVEDFPIAQLAAAAEGDGTRSDATEREGEHGELAAGEGAGVAGVGRRREGWEFDGGGSGGDAEKSTAGGGHRRPDYPIEKGHSFPPIKNIGVERGNESGFPGGRRAADEQGWTGIRPGKIGGR